MELIWWIVPAIAGVVGLLLTFAGFGRLARLNLLSGGARVLFGVGSLGAAGVIAFAGLNLQTYKRLVYEQPVATMTFHEIADGDEAYRVELVLHPENERYQCVTDGVRSDCVISGDEFSLGARVITFKPAANMIGYDSVYRLDYLEGRMARRYSARQVTPAQTNGVALSENPGLDVAALAREQGSRIGLRDANFGSAAYNPIGDGFAYEISLTRTGLIARAANDETRRALGELVGEAPAISQQDGG